MSRRIRIFRNAAIALGALTVVLGIAGILIVRSEWFQNYVKQTIIASTDDSTGGKTEIGTFRFGWTRLSAVANDFVIHGTEAEGVAPMLRVARIQLDFRLFTSLHHLWDITYLGVDRPQVNVIVYPDGQTNIPSPRTKSSSNVSPLETLVDLAIGRFELANGLVTLAAKKQEVNVRGNNLRAQLGYNILSHEYRGQISLKPTYVVSGRNTPVAFTVNLPLVLARNRIDLQSANITSSGSTLKFSASIEDLRDPKVSVRATGHIAIADLKEAINLPLSTKATNVPSAIQLDADASAKNDGIEVAGLRLTLGHSNIEASGSLKHGLAFKSRLALGELGRLTNQTGVPYEIASVNGAATLDSQNNLNLTGLEASTLGAEFTGEAALKDASQYQVQGELKRLDLARAIHAAGMSRLPYDGVLSGPIDVEGRLKDGLRGFAARAKLSIAPGTRGVPFSGRLTAAYSGATDNLSVEHSLLTLPHTRLSVDGSVGKRLKIDVTTTDLEDLLAAIPEGSRPQLALRGGQAEFTGVITGRLTAPNVSGHLMSGRFTVAGRQFDSFNADASVARNGLAIHNGSVARNTMRAQFSGRLELRNWTPIESSALSANASIQNGDLADLLALAGQPSRMYSGQLNGNATLNGTLSNPRGAGSLVATHGMLDGQPFDRAEAQVNLTDQLVTAPRAFLQLGPAHLNLTGEFRHPRDSFTTGQLHADIQSDQIDLAQLDALQKQRPDTRGMVQVNANVIADLSGPLQIRSINGNASIQGLQSQGQNYGDLSITANTTGQLANFAVTSNFAGSSLKIDGATELTRDYPTTARANIGNLPVERLLAIAKRTDIPIKGALSGTANLNGTVSNPQGSADLSLAKATIYDDNVDRVHARVTYQPQSVELSQLELVSRASRIQLTGRYDHPAGRLESGNLQFRLETNGVDLARVKTLSAKWREVGGTLQATASGAAEIRAAAPRILAREFSANLKTTGLAVQGKNLGDLTLTAKTAGGRVSVALDSTIAGATMEGRGNVELATGYPSDAQLTFKNMTWAGLRPLLGYEVTEGRGFEAVSDGQLSVNGPLLDSQQLRGSVQVTRLEVTGDSSAFRKPNQMLLLNQGPIAAILDSGTLKMQSAHVAGPQTDLQASGTIPLNGQAMDIALNGNVNLAVLEQFDESITASGNVAVAAGVRGSPTNPRMTGQLELRNASFIYPDMPAGISKANGVVLLNGNSAVIRNLKAEAGGGQLSVTGSATLNDTLRFGLQATATQVRIMVQQGVGLVASANVSLSGTTENSSISGSVTVDRISYAAQSDLGSLLSLAAPPVQASGVQSSFLENMRLDVRVRSSNALGVQSSLAQNVQLTADLRIRGSAAHPSMLGRVLVTEGKLVFFGSTYTVNSGTIGFYNPVRIEPILDLSLETQSQGVDVVLKVTGPIDNMKLSYTSDPPLQFQEIVNLLATGTTPTSDPTLLANQPTVAAQSFEQMGESAIVGHAFADPVANQLQRVFGVTQFKINPAFTSGSQLPAAQLSLQQQISNNVTFTYVSGFNTANAETIQAVWTFTPQWSAQALRDYNGIFSVTLLYKRQLR
jgi:translocation and assembly module TamB